MRQFLSSELIKRAPPLSESSKQDTSCFFPIFPQIYIHTYIYKNTKYPLELFLSLVLTSSSVVINVGIYDITFRKKKRKKKEIGRQSACSIYERSGRFRPSDDVTRITSASPTFFPSGREREGKLTRAGEQRERERTFFPREFYLSLRSSSLRNPRIFHFPKGTI